MAVTNFTHMFLDTVSSGTLGEVVPVTGAIPVLDAWINKSVVIRSKHIGLFGIYSFSKKFLNWLLQGVCPQ